MSGAEVLDTQGPAGAVECTGDVPSLKEIEQLLNTGRPSCNHVDEVWPNLFLGDLQLLYQTQENEKLSLIQPECVQKSSKMPHTKDSSSLTSNDSYETPALSDLQRLLWFRGGSDNHVDQVWPNIYLGDAWAARSKTTLQSLNITHILNAADGPYSINTGAKYYEDLQIEYYGVEAFDDPSFDLSIFFYDAANFIGQALNSSGGKVFVHCAMGVSRSATLVLAFLMIHENLTLVDALKTVGAHRDICPNSGFLSQLRDLDIKLNEEKKGTRASAPKEL
ncbi:dual specificity protein phosphatase 13B-like isoform X1 [Pseudopipra pipra]|uniref:dual specificity protein phosphatase 13B-like isoform X1 n=2 Tax=Pseudopipra pipra TaxID=415032 RepID=UPI003139E965